LLSPSFFPQDPSFFIIVTYCSASNYPIVRKRWILIKDWEWIHIPN
jgi:hypothetical protein